MRHRDWIVVGLATQVFVLVLVQVTWATEPNGAAAAATETGADQPSSSEASAAESSRADLDFFEKKIRPVLVERCYSCHSAEAQAAGKLKGGLLLDTRVAMRAGGDSGPAVTPHDIDGSLLIESLRYDENSYQMPPDGKLADDVIANFEHWIQRGAADPRDGKGRAETGGIDWQSARQFWSLQPPRAHEPPRVRDSDWSRTSIDSFILAKIEAAGLTPAPPANRNTLLRRACFDLTGLPPTVEQIDRFLADDTPDAYARLIDRLLDSPHYGERWGRHWLDVARYSEDNTNMGPHNGPYPHAWRYRDWVTQALNDDVPYDAFIIRQLATDFLPETGPADHAALGFQGLAPSYHKEVALAKLVLENRYADEWEDRVDAIGRGLLGLTLACARCHDHKYDPITVEDYYALAGVFASCRQTTRPVIPADEIAKTQPVRDRAAALEKELAETEKLVKALPTEIAKLEKELQQHAAQVEAAKKAAAAETATSSSESATAASDDGGAPAEPCDDAAAKAPDAPPVDFDADAAKQRLADAKAKLTQAKQQVAAAKTEVAELKKTPGFEIPVANALTEEQVRVEEITKEKMKIVYFADKPRDLNVFIRGDAGRLGEVVPRRFLQILADADQPSPQEFTTGSGRLELARAIASRDNPLTARVMVNRVWMHHFGVGLVSSPSNFGVTGSPPSHPKLLDALAVAFMDNGWSLKWLHREIMLSATYRLDSNSANSPTQQAADQDNRLLSHFHRRRLDAESFRDAALAVSGRLDLTPGGPSGDADSPDFQRRTCYSIVSRHKLSDTLQAFDFPDPAIHCADRAQTTTPLQQMFVLNSPFMQKTAESLATRIQDEGGSETEARVDFAHRLLFGRSATPAELAIGNEYLALAAAEPVRWVRYAHALLGSNEFMYVD